MLLQPERINPELNQKGYNVKSDVWSLGITMVMPRAGTGTLQPRGWVGMGSALAGLYPCRQQLNSERDSLRHEITCPGHRVEVLPSAHRGTSPRAGSCEPVCAHHCCGSCQVGWQACQEIIHFLPFLFPPLPSCRILGDTKRPVIPTWFPCTFPFGFTELVVYNANSK